MKDMSRPNQTARAYTLVEIITVVTVLGIISAVSYGLIKDAVPAAQERRAIAAANAINAAKYAYALRVSNASTAWTAAGTDTAKFLLVRDRIPFADTMTLSQFTPPGFTLGLGATPKARVTITGPSGSLSY